MSARAALRSSLAGARSDARADALAQGPAPTALALEVLAVVEQIPPAKVMSYGDIAELVGRGAPRGVGMVMAQHGHEVCWWRVVQASGAPTRSAPAEALRHLVAEGTPLRSVGEEQRVDMAIARWDGR